MYYLVTKKYSSWYNRQGFCSTWVYWASLIIGQNCGISQRLQPWYSCTPVLHIRGPFQSWAVRNVSLDDFLEFIYGCNTFWALAPSSTCSAISTATYTILTISWLWCLQQLERKYKENIINYSIIIRSTGAIYGGVRYVWKLEIAGWSSKRLATSCQYKGRLRGFIECWHLDHPEARSKRAGSHYYKSIQFYTSACYMSVIPTCVRPAGQVKIATKYYYSGVSFSVSTVMSRITVLCRYRAVDSCQALYILYIKSTLYYYC